LFYVAKVPVLSYSRSATRRSAPNCNKGIKGLGKRALCLSYSYFIQFTVPGRVYIHAVRLEAVISSTHAAVEHSGIEKADANAPFA